MPDTNAAPDWNAVDTWKTGVANALRAQGYDEAEAHAARDHYFESVKNLPPADAAGYIAKVSPHPRTVADRRSEMLERTRQSVDATADYRL